MNGAVDSEPYADVTKAMSEGESGLRFIIQFFYFSLLCRWSILILSGSVTLFGTYQKLKQ